MKRTVSRNGGMIFRPEYAALGQLRQRFPAFAVYGIDRHRRRHHARGYYSSAWA